MKKKDQILSYIFPISVERTNSIFNPVLEVVLINGKYSLNSENTNYSHGSLYTVFEKVFEKINPNWDNIHRVLIVGFGAGSIAEIIRKYNTDCSIDGVEIDQKVIDLSEKYFNLHALKNVNVYCTSAAHYFNDCKSQYDLIIIDVFIDKIVPKEAETEQFLNRVKNVMTNGGLVIFNKVTYTKTISEQIPALKDLYEKTFHNLELLTIMKTGKIFISKKQDENKAS